MVQFLHQLCRKFSLSQTFDLLEMSQEQFLGCWKNGNAGAYSHTDSICLGSV